ncbi:MAG TPA: PfkB family carbohydrate kinase [Ignavibacteriaceae bacterium]
MTRILLIGQSVEDRICYRDNYQIKPGGIYYSAAALQYIKDPDDEIYLCTSCRKNDELFRELYEKINPGYFNYTDVIPKVRLNIYDDRERDEIYENITGELSLSTADLNRFDGILINMVTGFDISLKQMEEIRNNYNGMIYFDVHTFSRGLNNKMEREFRVIPGFEKWLKNIDILQTNSRELFTLKNSDDRDAIIKCVLHSNVKYLLETKGSKGAVCFSRKNSDIVMDEMPAISINVKNQVGLGDVFGAVYFYSYIKNKIPSTALKTAVVAAGYAATYNDINDFQNLKNDVFARYN